MGYQEIILGWFTRRLAWQCLDFCYNWYIFTYIYIFIFIYIDIYKYRIPYNRSEIYTNICRNTLNVLKLHNICRNTLKLFKNHLKVHKNIKNTKIKVEKLKNIHVGIPNWVNPVSNTSKVRLNVYIFEKIQKVYVRFPKNSKWYEYPRKSVLYYCSRLLQCYCLLSEVNWTIIDEDTNFSRQPPIC